MITDLDSKEYKDIKPALDEIFSIASAHLMQLPQTRVETFQQLWSMTERGLMEYPPVIRLSEEINKVITSPTYAVLNELGSPIVATRHEKTSDMIRKVDGINLGHILSNIVVRSLAQVSTIQALMKELEFVFAARPVRQWSVFLVQLAKKFDLKWNHGHIVDGLVDPASKPSEAAAAAASTGRTRMEEVLSKFCMPKDATIRFLDQPARGVFDHHAFVKTSDKTEIEEYNELYGPIVSENDMVADFDGDTIGSGQEAPLYSDIIGKCFTFVTETKPYRLIYGEVVGVNREYSKEYPEGLEVTILNEIPTEEQIDNDDETQAGIRIVEWDKSVVCESNQIHYTDFNKIIKRLLAVSR